MSFAPVIDHQWVTPRESSCQCNSDRTVNFTRLLILAFHKLLYLRNLVLVLPSVICLVICSKSTAAKRTRSTDPRCSLHQTYLLWPLLPSPGQHCYLNGDTADLIQVQDIPSRKKRASFHKDWFPILGTMISHKHPSHYIYGTEPHHFHLCTFHSAQGTLVLFGPQHVKHRSSMWMIKESK